MAGLPHPSPMSADSGPVGPGAPEISLAVTGVEDSVAVALLVSNSEWDRVIAVHMLPDRAIELAHSLMVAATRFN